MVLDGLEQVPDSVCTTGLRVSGTDLCTHGPDPAPAGVDIRKSVEPVPPDQLKPHAVQCNGDGNSGLRTQVIYARASDVADTRQRAGRGEAGHQRLPVRAKTCGQRPHARERRVRG